MAETENVKAADLSVCLPWQQLPDNVDEEGFYFFTPFQQTLMEPAAADLRHLHYWYFYDNFICYPLLSSRDMEVIVTWTGVNSSYSLDDLQLDLICLRLGLMSHSRL